MPPRDKTKPKFKNHHNKFLGHYNGYDIYLCGNTNITARWSSGPGDYEICRIDTLFSHFSRSDVISGFAERNQFWYFAMMTALADLKVKELDET